MEFKFEKGTEKLVGTLAFALYEDNSICVASAAGKPLDIYQLSQVAGFAIKDALANIANRTGKTYVERRDEAHEIVRLFATALGTNPSSIAWRKASEEEPAHNENVLFKLDRGTDTLYGYYDLLAQMFIDVSDNDRHHLVSDVSYWMPTPETPEE